MNMNEPTLDCQTCGRAILVLTPTGYQKVAENPQDYIMDCATCKRDRENEIEAAYDRGYSFGYSAGYNEGQR